MKRLRMFCSRNRGALLLAAASMFVLAAPAWCAETTALPKVAIQVGDEKLSSGGDVASAVKLLFLIAALSFAPAMVLTMTCFTRIAVVLGMTRTAIGTQQMPPNLVVTGLAMFLTISIMQPIFQKMYTDGIGPFLREEMGVEEAARRAGAPLKSFLLRHSRESDLALFLEVTHSEVPESAEDVPFFVVVPAFVLSELHIAFQIGFLIALPFLVLDMVVSSVLTAMSMITLPPVVISLPLKMMLFVLVDGWHLIVASLVKTYHVS